MTLMMLCLRFSNCRMLSGLCFLTFPFWMEGVRRETRERRSYATENSGGHVASLFHLGPSPNPCWAEDCTVCVDADGMDEPLKMNAI